MHDCTPLTVCVLSCACMFWLQVRQIDIGRLGRHTLCCSKVTHGLKSANQMQAAPVFTSLFLSCMLFEVEHSNTTSNVTNGQQLFSSGGGSTPAVHAHWGVHQFWYVATRFHALDKSMTVLLLTGGYFELEFACVVANIDKGDILLHTIIAAS